MNDVWFIVWIACATAFAMMLTLILYAIRAAWYSHQQRKKMQMSEQWLLRQHRERNR